jgi:hypothetical protein
MSFGEAGLLGKEALCFNWRCSQGGKKYLGFGQMQHVWISSMAAMPRYVTGCVLFIDHFGAAAKEIVFSFMVEKTLSLRGVLDIAQPIAGFDIKLTLCAAGKGAQG